MDPHNNMPASSTDPTLPPSSSSSFTIPIVQNDNPATPANPANPAANKTITADEIALYDRQIRLWGIAAQAKIQSANILLITIRALANEIAKNLVLAGIASLTLLDDQPVSEADLGAQFLLSEAHPDPDDHNPSAGPLPPLGHNRAEACRPALQKLNPRVQIHADAGGVKSKGPSYFAGFDVVIATDLDPDSLHLINTATRLNGRPFYAAGSHGLYGFIFSDLIEHDFVIRRDLGNVATLPGAQETRTRRVVGVTAAKEPGANKTVESVTKRELYSTWFLASDAAKLPADLARSKRRLRSVTPVLSCFRALWAFTQASGGRLPYPAASRDDVVLFTQLATSKHRALGLPAETLRPDLLRSFLQNLGCEMAPTAAILGGQLAQDVINVLGRSQQPIQNMVIFDGNAMEAPVYPLHPEGPLGRDLLSIGAEPGAPPIVPDASVPGAVPISQAI